MGQVEASLRLVPKPAAGAAQRPRRPGGAVWLRRLRQWHLYSGVVFAPAIVFLAFTGALQVLDLHKADPAARYKPPAWIEAVAAVHKRQTMAPKADDGAKPSKAGPKAPKAAPKKPARTPAGVVLMKAFALLASAGLIGSALSGIYVGLRTARRPALVWALLAAGVALPALFLVL